LRTKEILPPDKSHPVTREYLIFIDFQAPSGYSYALFATPSARAAEG
jgi:hypothetical protein